MIRKIFAITFLIALPLASAFAQQEKFIQTSWGGRGPLVTISIELFHSFLPAGTAH
jgi:hypothetical protein